MKTTLMISKWIAISLVMTFAACGGEAPLDGAALVVEKGCVACHGEKGGAIAPIYPNLNGQYETYLRLQLVAYKSGKRVNAVMNGMAANLSDEEITALAAHYGK